MLPPINTPLFFLSLSTAAATPSLLNPIRLIIPLSSISRKSRFLGFPGCGLGVMVPISIKPKPKLDSSWYKVASLSKPAANPIGFLKCNPKTSRCKEGCST